MQSQNRINTNDHWYRCSRVDFSGEKVTWELARTPGYDFRDAYEKDPHRQLIRATDNESLRVFVKAWGPLRDRRLNSWSGTDKVDFYRKMRDRLETIARLIASGARTPEKQRDALQRFVLLAEYDEEAQRLIEAVIRHPRLSNYVKAFLTSEEDTETWLSHSRRSGVRLVIKWLVSELAPPATTERIQAETHGRPLRVSLGINNLVDALDWMLWEDMRLGRPIQFCLECDQLIHRKPTKHAKKYCSPACAHRRTGREWQQRERKEERERNGTEKAR
jgi:hypothetical protein